jgi:hypothetical protein
LERRGIQNEKFKMKNGGIGVEDGRSMFVLREFGSLGEGA